MFIKRINVGDLERAVVYRGNRFATILGPGEHYIFTGFRSVRVEMYNLQTLSLSSDLSDYLVKYRPDVVNEYFTLVETNEAQVAVIYADHRLVRVQPPASRVLYWKGLREITADVMELEITPEVPERLIPGLKRLGPASLVQTATVDEHKTGLLYLDGQFRKSLKPGLHGFWTATRAVRVDTVDLRRQTIEVPGQEILTRDKVSIRVNVLADFRVLDPVKANESVKNYTETLYRLLQLAVRQTLGKRSLDDVLAEKVDVDPVAAELVRAEMKTMGVEVGAIALKDIILPGEIRDILNQVVTAEKQAQANLIRRREETAATRSLLNTAKLMEDNPTLVRLKELETLERVTEKVEHLTVHGGFESLLTRLLPP